MVSERAADIAYVDMRYTNGFAIGWRGNATRLALQRAPAHRNCSIRMPKRPDRKSSSWASTSAPRRSSRWWARSGCRRLDRGDRLGSSPRAA
jgi:hypothetical protein